MRARLLGFLLGAMVATAQTTKTEIPRLHDGKPDLNGVWDIPYTNDMAEAFRAACLSRLRAPTISKTTIRPSSITRGIVYRRV